MENKMEEYFMNLKCQVCKKEKPTRLILNKLKWETICKYCSIQKEI